MDIKIEKTDNYLELAPLFKRNGLEVDLDKAPETMIACYRAVDKKGRLLGGVSVEHKVGIYTVGDIAVEEELRDLDIGTELLKTAMEYIFQQGSKEIYLVAKAPKFFQKFGFSYITKEEAPDFTNCLKCEQFEVKCFPRLMRLNRDKVINMVP